MPQHVLQDAAVLEVIQFLDGIDAADERQLLARAVSRNDLGEECYSSPAISRGQIFIRTLNHLHCIGTTGKEGSKGEK